MLKKIDITYESHGKVLQIKSTLIQQSTEILKPISQSEAIYGASLLSAGLEIHSFLIADIDIALAHPLIRIFENTQVKIRSSCIDRLL